MMEKKTILLIDDDPDMRELLDISFRMAGYQTITAVNGEDAKAMLIGNWSIDLILCDLVMPVMDGLRFIRWLRNEAKLTIPTVVLSGLRKPDLEAQIIEAGGASTVVLGKPIKIPNLLQRLQDILES